MAKMLYEWFVQPLKSSRTNKVIGHYLPESDFQELTCADGKRRPLWQCSFELARYLWNSRSELGINIRIFGRQGRGADIRGPLRNLDIIFASKRQKISKPKTKATS